MTRRRTEIIERALSAALLFGVASALVACGGSSSNNNTGTGGHGGVVATGGRGGSSSGGRTGAGGSSMGGAGGMVSAACGVARYTHVSPFGNILDGWVVATNSTPPTLAPVEVDGGLISGTKVEIDHTDGSPATSPVNGSVKLTIPFANPNEEMLFAQNSSGLNMSGTTITAQIKLDSGLNTSATNVGRAFLTLKSTAGYIYAAGTAVSLDSSAGWVTLSISADNPGTSIPPGYDPCDIREIDVAVQTGGQGTFTPAVIHIDTIAVSLPGTDAGTGTDTGTETDSGPATDSGATDAVDAPAPTDTGDTTDASTATDAPTDVPQGTDAVVDAPPAG